VPVLAKVQRSTARNDETMSALNFLKRHRATLQQAAARSAMKATMASFDPDLGVAVFAS